MTNSLTHTRNVAFVGPNHAGKTSLIEAILHSTGAITRRGKIADGTMTMDHEPEAIARQISTSTSFARFTYKDITFNVLDCPGFVDFVEEAKLALLGCDTAVFVVEPDPQKLIQMDSLLHFAEELGLACLVFVNKMDKPDIDFHETLDALNAMTGVKTLHPMTALEYPISDASGITGYEDVLKMEAYKFGAQGKAEKMPAPDALITEVENAHEKLIENLADTDDAVLELVMDGKEPPVDLLQKDLKKAVREGKCVPILVGSAHTDAGVFALLDTLVDVCPSPAERQYKDKNGKVIAVSENGPVIAQVIKTYIHPQFGKLSLTRVISGTISGDAHLVDSSRSGAKEERIGGLYWLLGKKQETMPSAPAGSIVAIARLESAHTGDTIVAGKDSTVMFAPPAPPPLYSLAITPKTHGDEAKLSTLLAKIIEEDPTIKVDRDPDTNEYCIYGQGEVHLTLTRQRLERKYHLELESKRPLIAYKETIQSKVEAHGRHKKQSGGRGQFGEVYLRLEPQERSSGVKFSESIVGGAIPRQYIPGVEKGVMEALQRGPLANFPVVDISVNLFDGSFHDVDSDEMSFKMAAIVAMREGLQKSHPIILEPIAEVKVVVPSAHTSGVLSQITGRRGHILGYGPSGTRAGWDEVSAHVPQGELWDYIIELRTLSHGLGYYTWQFDHLSPVPVQLSQELISQAAATHDHSHG
ncbi:MAG: elongation factor G [Candidatus Obscuribacterales bacterium]|nr:elongation factor G [Candidatus Obscuribacterales bacterium]